VTKSKLDYKILDPETKSLSPGPEQ
jgi:hypothetical protein